MKVEGVSSVDIIESNSQGHEEILEAYAMVLSGLKEIMQDDLMVLITNRTHILYFYPGRKLDISNGEQTVGLKLPPDDDLSRCMKTGKPNVVVAGKERFGFPFLGITSPIVTSSGEIIGCVSVGRSLEKEARIEEISHSLAATMQEVNAGLQEVASGSQGLSFRLTNAVKSANESAVKIKEINKVISAISDISTHSNLLGLNAAIEAARAGEQGRGFAVVAEEMRKLAAQSKDSATMVTDILTEMKVSIEGVITEINQIGNIAENQAAATEEITAAVSDVSENSQNLMAFSKIKIGDQ